jgi:hypothetical protein
LGIGVNPAKLLPDQLRVTIRHGTVASHGRADLVPNTAPDPATCKYLAYVVVIDSVEHPRFNVRGLGKAFNLVGRHRYVLVVVVAYRIDKQVEILLGINADDELFLGIWAGEAKIGPTNVARAGQDAVQNTTCSEVSSSLSINSFRLG